MGKSAKKTLAGKGKAEKDPNRDSKGHFIKGCNANPAGRPTSASRQQTNKEIIEASKLPMPFTLVTGATTKEVIAANSVQFLYWAMRRALQTPDTALGGKMAVLLANKMLPSIQDHNPKNRRVFRETERIPLPILRQMAKGIAIEDAEYAHEHGNGSGKVVQDVDAVPLGDEVAAEPVSQPVSDKIDAVAGEMAGMQVVRPKVGEDRVVGGEFSGSRGGG